MKVWNLPRGLSVKALAVLSGAIFFCILEIGGALYFKVDLLEDFARIRQLHRYEGELLVSKFASSDLLFDLWGQTRVESPEQLAEWLDHWQMHLTNLVKLERTSPDAAGKGLSSAELRRATAALDEFRKTPHLAAELGNVVDRLREAVKDFDGQLNDRLEKVRANYDRVYGEYHKKTNFYALVVLVIGLLFFGLAAFVAAAFFFRLVEALRQIQRRAESIMAGNYGTPLSIDRRDEVGQLTDAINEMAHSLENQEIQAADFQQRLRRQENLFAIGTFAAGIAHEIGNPIQATLALTNQISESLSEDNSDENIARNIERIEMIAQQAERLSATIREISEFGTPAESEMEPVNVNQVIEATVRLLRFDPRFQNISLTMDLSNNNVRVMGVADQLVQVMMNSLINAADALGERGGSIAVVSRHEGKDVVVTISDDGIGMPEEILAHVTEPFFTTKASGKGTGLGLAVCKTIIEEHLGNLKIESAPNEGTTLSIFLPAVQEAHVS